MTMTAPFFPIRLELTKCAQMTYKKISQLKQAVTKSHSSGDFSISEHCSRTGNCILINKHVLIVVFGLMGQSGAFR